MKRAGTAAAAAVAAGFVLAAAATATPASSRESASAAGSPVVFAASSLTESLPRIAPSARFFFAGSNQLAQQIRLGAPFDVFLSAGPEYTRALYAERLVRKPAVFASNSLVVIVPRTNPARVFSLADLGMRPELRLVVAGAKVPIGRYTRELLRRAGLSGLLARVVSFEPDVKGIVGKVALGEADAGFVYATDVAPVRDRVGVIRIAESAQPTIRLEVAIATEPRNPAAARSFVASVLSRRGRSVLSAAGFGNP